MLRSLALLSFFLTSAFHLFSASLFALPLSFCLSGSTGDSLEVWRELDTQQVEKDLKGVLARGITSLAVLLLHSYTYVRGARDETELS